MKLLIGSTELYPYYTIEREPIFGCWCYVEAEVPAGKYRKWKKAISDFNKAQHEMSSYYNKSNEQTKT